jgi:hypothetical protein
MMLGGKSSDFLPKRNPGGGYANESGVRIIFEQPLLFLSFWLLFPLWSWVFW